MVKTFKAKDALDYLYTVYMAYKRELSAETKQFLETCGYDFYMSIGQAQRLIRSRYYVMEHDEDDYIILTNMQLILKKHFQIFTMIENKVIKNNTKIQINIYDA